MKSKALYSGASLRLITYEMPNSIFENFEW